MAEQLVPMQGWISPRLQCSHSLSPPSYQIKLTLVGDPYQFLRIGLGGGWQMHTEGSGAVCGCLPGLHGQRRVDISAAGGQQSGHPSSLIQTHPSYEDAMISASGL